MLCTSWKTIHSFFYSWPEFLPSWSSKSDGMSRGLLRDSPPAWFYMLTWHGNMVHITGPLWEEQDSHHNVPVMWNLDVFFVVGPNKPWNKQMGFCMWLMWAMTLMWRHCHEWFVASTEAALLHKQQAAISHFLRYCVMWPWCGTVMGTFLVCKQWRYAWALFQYVISQLIIRSHDISKPWDW